MDTKKGIRKSLISSDFLHSIDNLSSEELHELVNGIKKNPIEPFKFLSNVLDQVDDGDHNSSSSIKPTDIDSQLASLVKRVEMNISLLERTNQRVKDINFTIEKNKILALRELNYNKETLSKVDEYEFKVESNIEHPEIDKIQRTMNDTLRMLECIKEVTFTDPDSEKLSSEFVTKQELGQVNQCPNQSKTNKNVNQESAVHKKDELK